MDTNEQRLRNTLIIEKNAHLENLLANDDFVKWRDETVLARMESIIDSIRSVDRTAPDWKEKVCDAVVAYQESRVVYEAVFKLAEMRSKVARGEINKLSSAQS